MPFRFDIPKAQFELEMIHLVFNKYGVSFSKREAARLVGGEYRLEKLVSEGKIEMDKPSDKQNGKWRCKGSDVLRYVKL